MLLTVQEDPHRGKHCNSTSWKNYDVMCMTDGINGQRISFSALYVLYEKLWPRKRGKKTACLPCSSWGTSVLSRQGEERNDDWRGLDNVWEESPSSGVLRGSVHVTCSDSSQASELKKLNLCCRSTDVTFWSLLSLGSLIVAELKRKRPCPHREYKDLFFQTILCFHWGKMIFFYLKLDCACWIILCSIKALL